MGLLDDFDDQELLSRAAGGEDIAAGIATSLAGRSVLLTWLKRLAEHLSEVRITESVRLPCNRVGLRAENCRRLLVSLGTADFHPRLETSGLRLYVER